MTPHKYAVGETVEFQPGRWDANTPRGRYTPSPVPCPATTWTAPTAPAAPRMGWNGSSARRSFAPAGRPRSADPRGGGRFFSRPGICQNRVPWPNRTDANRRAQNA
jgi:hypothetical protein